MSRRRRLKLERGDSFPDFPSVLISEIFGVRLTEIINAGEPTKARRDSSVSPRQDNIHAESFKNIAACPELKQRPEKAFRGVFKAGIDI